MAFRRGVPAAEQWPILDVAAVPYLTSQGRSTYQDFLLMDVPRAMAVGRNGQYGWYGGGRSVEDASTRALRSCADKGGADCAIHAEDVQGRVAGPATPTSFLRCRGH